MNTFHRYGLYPTVFITGAAILVVEILATRLLAPYYGTTIFSTSSIITVILAALSIGYWIGGRYSDKHCHLDHFAWFIAAGGVGVLVIAVLNSLFVPVIGYQLSLTSGPLLLSLFLFFGPILLLGMLSPYAIALQNAFSPEVGIGTISGRIFFWSTLGSIAGSLLTAYLLIPSFTIPQILVATGVVLTALGVGIRLIAGTHYQATLPMVFFAVALFYGEGVSPFLSPAIYQSQGVYSQITVFDAPYDGEETRFLVQDRQSSGALNKASGKSAFEYAKYYDIYRLFNRDIKNALIIGGGAYIIPKMLHENKPSVSIDVAEIEPNLEALSKEYFQLPDTPQIKTHVKDGRRLLLDSNQQYDYIFSDAFSSLYGQPTQLVSKAFFDLAKKRLNDNGIFIANIIGYFPPEGGPSLAGSAYLTMKSVFPEHLLIAVESNEIHKIQNFIFVGMNGKMPNVDYHFLRRHPDPLFSELGEKVILTEKLRLENELIFTDSYAPVESLSAQALTYGVTAKKIS